MAKSGITKWHGKAIAMKVDVVTTRAVTKAANLVERDVKTHFTRQGSYDATRRKGGRTHWSSAPGQAPAIDMGILKSSIQSFVNVIRGKISGRVGPDIGHIASRSDAGTDVNYGLYLEVGTKNMAARPFLRPALRRQRRRILGLFRGLLPR